MIFEIFSSLVNLHALALANVIDLYGVIPSSNFEGQVASNGELTLLFFSASCTYLEPSRRWIEIGTLKMDFHWIKGKSRSIA